MFIYFLHYITQTVKFETIIKRVHQQTLDTLQKQEDNQSQQAFTLPDTPPQVVCMPVSNYYQSFDKRELLRFTDKHEGMIRFLHPEGTYLLAGMPLLEFYSTRLLTKNMIGELLNDIDFYVGQPVEQNAYFGFHQLAEIALKALSPGINDPQTAVLSLHAITDLFAYLLTHEPKIHFEDRSGTTRII